MLSDRQHINLKKTLSKSNIKSNDHSLSLTSRRNENTSKSPSLIKKDDKCIPKVNTTHTSSTVDSITGYDDNTNNHSKNITKNNRSKSPVSVIEKVKLKKIAISKKNNTHKIPINLTKSGINMINTSCTNSMTKLKEKENKNSLNITQSIIFPTAKNIDDLFEFDESYQLTEESIKPIDIKAIHENNNNNNPKNRSLQIVDVDIINEDKGKGKLKSNRIVENNKMIYQNKITDRSNRSIDNSIILENKVKHKSTKSIDNTENKNENKVRCISKEKKNTLNNTGYEDNEDELNKELKEKSTNENKYVKFEDFWKSINQMKQDFYKRLTIIMKDKEYNVDETIKNSILALDHKAYQNIQLLNYSIEDLINKNIHQNDTHQKQHQHQQSINQFGQQHSRKQSGNQFEQQQQQSRQLQNQSRQKRHSISLGQDSFSLISKEDLNDEPKSNMLMGQFKKFNESIFKIEKGNNAQNTKTYYLGRSPSVLLEPNDGIKENILQNQSLEMNELLTKKTSQNLQFINNSFQVNDGYIANPASDYSSVGNNQENNSLDISLIGRNNNHHQINQSILIDKHNISCTNNTQNHNFSLNHHDVSIKNLYTKTDEEPYVDNNKVLELEKLLMKTKEDYAKLEFEFNEKSIIINDVKNSLKAKEDELIKEKNERNKETTKTKELNEEFTKERKKLETMLDQTINKLQALQQLCLDNGNQIDKLKKDNKALDVEKKVLTKRIKELENNLQIQIDLNKDLTEKINAHAISKTVNGTLKSSQNLDHIEDGALRLQGLLKNCEDEREKLKNENNQLKESLMKIKAEKEQSEMGLKEENKKLEKYISNLNKELEQVNTKRKEIENMIQNAYLKEEELKEEVSCLLEENERNMARIKELNEELKEIQEIKNGRINEIQIKNNKEFEIVQEEINDDDQLENGENELRRLNVIRQEMIIQEMYNTSNSTSGYNSSGGEQYESNITLKKNHSSLKGSKICECEETKCKLKQFEIENENLRNQNKELLQEIEHLKELNLDLKKKCITWDNNESEIQEEYSKSQNKSALLKENNEQLMNENQELETHYQEITNRLKELNEENDLLKQDNQLLMAKLQKIDQEMMILQEENQKLQVRLQKYHKMQNPGYDYEYESLSNSIYCEFEGIKSLNQDFSEQLDNLKKENSQGHSENLEIKDELDAKNCEISKLTCKNKESKAQIQNQNQSLSANFNLKSLEFDLESTQKEILSLRSEIHSLQTENDQLKLLLSKTTSKDKSAGSFEDLSREYDMFKEESQTEIQKLQQKLAEADMHASENSSFKAMLRDSEAKIVILEATLHDYQLKIQQYENQIEELIKNNSHMSDNLSNADKEKIDELIEKIELQKNALDQYEELLLEYQMNNKDQQNEIHALKSTIKSLKEEAMQTPQRLSTKNVDIDLDKNL